MITERKIIEFHVPVQRHTQIFMGKYFIKALTPVIESGEHPNPEHLEMASVPKLKWEKGKQSTKRKKKIALTPVFRNNCKDTAVCIFAHLFWFFFLTQSWGHIGCIALLSGFSVWIIPHIIF